MTAFPGLPSILSPISLIAAISPARASVSSLSARRSRRGLCVSGSTSFMTMRTASAHGFLRLTLAFNQRDGVAGQKIKPRSVRAGLERVNLWVRNSITFLPQINPARFDFIAVYKYCGSSPASSGLRLLCHNTAMTPGINLTTYHADKN